MENSKTHITNYSVYLKVLASLLLLTAITVGVAWFHFENWTIIVAMLIASLKAFLVLTFFMHLKYEKLVLKLMVGMVFLLLVVVFVILFFDYWFR